MSEIVVPSGASHEPLDLEDLWPITTDLVNATQSASSSISALAYSLAEDNNAGAAPIRQQLREIRARLVYILTDVISAIVTPSSILMSSGAIIMSDNVHSEPREGLLVALESQWTAVVDACAAARQGFEECLSAWQSFYPCLLDYRSARSRQTGPVASFLRALGTFASEPAASSSAAGQHSPKSSFGTGAVAGVQRDLESVCDGLTQLEAFWRKRQNVFSSPTDACSRERLVRYYPTWARIGAEHTVFIDLFYSCIDSVQFPDPSITKSPDDLSDAIRLKMAWRALLVD